MMRDTLIAATAMSRFGKYPERSVPQLTAEVVQTLLQRSGVERNQLQAAFFSNCGWGISDGQSSIRGQVALRPCGIEGLPISNIENACASGSTAIHLGHATIQAGMADVVLVVGAEKIYTPDPIMMFSAFLGGMDVAAIKDEMPKVIEMAASLPSDDDESLGTRNKGPAEKGQKKKKKKPGWWQMFKDMIILRERYGKETFAAMAKMSGGKGDRSPFMDAYAIGARMHMRDHGLRPEHLAIVAAKNHNHGARNPLAQLRIPMTVEQVLADRQVSFPLTRSMCAPTGDGAAAALLVASDSEIGKALNGKGVRIRASVLGSATTRNFGEGESISHRVSQRAYEQAGLGPQDIDFAELHDATAFGEISQAEALGFCAEGDGGALAESGATAIGGRLPLNPSGGLECRGHPVGATGIAQMHECWLQLTGQAGERQIDGARMALTQNGGGFLGVEEASCTVHILEGSAK